MTPIIQQLLNSMPDKRVAVALSNIFNRALLPNGIDAAVTAHAGGTQASGMSLNPKCQFHVVTTCATAADSILLPPAVVGEVHWVKNSGAASMQVFGAGTDTIDSVATATGVPQNISEAVVYFCLVAGNYLRLGGVQVSSTFTALITGAITGSDSSLDILGQQAAQGGAIVVTGGVSTTAGNAGGAVSSVGGTPGVTGIGGAVSVTSGAGGATSGASGAATLATGTTTAESASASGNVLIQSGLGSNSTGATASGASGTVTVKSQASGTVATGTAANAGAVTISTGAGGAASGNGTAGNGGALACTSGVGGAAAGTGAAIGGVGGANTNTAGNGGAAAGTSPAGAGGAAGIVSGTGGAKTGTGTASGGAAGALSITAGTGGATASNSASGVGGAGGTITAAAGAGGAGTGTSAGGGAGGDVVIAPGAGGASSGGTAGLAGMIYNRGPVSRKVTVATMTDTATIAVASILAGTVKCTPTAAATYTMPTGAVLAAALPATFTTGDSLDFALVNIATNSSFDITVATAASGTTMYGCLQVSSNAAVTDISSGIFRLVCSGASTYDIYRVS